MATKLRAIGEKGWALPDCTMVRPGDVVVVGEHGLDAAEAARLVDIGYLEKVAEKKP